jgi:DNA-binding response OmpR family regulator
MVFWMKNPETERRKEMEREPWTLLVVDDEEKWLDVVANYLEGEGYRVIRALDGIEALSQIQKHPEIDAVLLDWMMPGMSGLDVCRRIRSFSDVPILFLTAKSEEVDKLLGLELGGDDYLTKPFSLREMVARIRAVLRRARGKDRGMGGSEEKFLRGPLEIDVPGHKVWLNGREISLTPTEFKLLTTLASKPGRTYSRLQLLESALGEEYAGYERSIDTHIHNLRKKIEENPSDPRFIQTVFGVGYRFGDVR